MLQITMITIEVNDQRNR